MTNDQALILFKSVAEKNTIDVNLLLDTLLKDMEAGYDLKILQPNPEKYREYLQNYIDKTFNSRIKTND